MGLIKLGIVLYGLHLITKPLREDRKCNASCGSPNYHEDPSNNHQRNQKPPGYPQTYPAPLPQNATYRDEKHLYSETPKADQQRMIDDNQQIQMREAPAYDEATANRFSGVSHECPNCGGHLQEKAVKNEL